MLEIVTSQRILVDQDNVLANFNEGFLIAWRKKYPDRPFIPLDKRQTFQIRDDYHKDFKEDIEDIYSSPGFIRNLRPIPGAIEALRAMQEIEYNREVSGKRRLKQWSDWQRLF